MSVWEWLDKSGASPITFGFAIFMVCLGIARIIEEWRGRE